MEKIINIEKKSRVDKDMRLQCNQRFRTSVSSGQQMSLSRDRLRKTTAIVLSNCLGTVFFLKICVKIYADLRLEPGSTGGHPRYFPRKLFMLDDLLSKRIVETASLRSTQSGPTVLLLLFFFSSANQIIHFHFFFFFFPLVREKNKISK